MSNRKASYRSYKLHVTDVTVTTLQRPANLAEILMGCEVSVNRGGFRHKYLDGTGGASRSKERRAIDPSPKRKRHLASNERAFCLATPTPSTCDTSLPKVCGKSLYLPLVVLEVRGCSTAHCASGDFDLVQETGSPRDPFSGSLISRRSRQKHGASSE